MLWQNIDLGFASFRHGREAYDCRVDCFIVACTSDFAAELSATPPSTLNQANKSHFCKHNLNS